MLLIPIVPSQSDIMVTENFLYRIQEVKKNANPFLSVYFILNKMTHTNKSKELRISMELS